MSIKSCMYTLLLFHALTNTNLCSDNTQNQTQIACNNLSLSTKVQELTNEITVFTQEINQNCFTYNQCIANPGLPQTVIEALKKDQSQKQREWKKRYQTLKATFHRLEETCNQSMIGIQKSTVSKTMPEFYISEIYAGYQKLLELNKELKNLLD